MIAIGRDKLIMKERTKNIIGFSIFFSIIILVIILRNTSQSDFKKNGLLINAQIIKVVIGGKPAGGFLCRFTYNDEVKENSTPTSLKKGYFDMIGKTFPAMYSPKMGSFEILITPTDFEKFNIPFPDSLNWVIKYTVDN